MFNRPGVCEGLGFIAANYLKRKYLLSYLYENHDDALSTIIQIKEGDIIHSF